MEGVKAEVADTGGRTTTPCARFSVFGEGGTAALASPLLDVTLPVPPFEKHSPNDVGLLDDVALLVMAAQRLISAAFLLHPFDFWPS